MDNHDDDDRSSAQQALGHNSKAVHHYYSKNADVVVPSLEDWETHWRASQRPNTSTAVYPTQTLQPPAPIAEN